MPTSSLHPTSSLLSPSASQYATPRLPSPQPGSNLSTVSSAPSFRTAHTSLSSAPSNLSTISQKDFSFLLRPEIYHPLTLLDVPPPFRISSAQPDPSTPLPELVKAGHFRSAAIKAVQLLTTPGVNTADHDFIFACLYTRLSCLTLCNQTALAAQEVKALEDLNSSYYRDDVSGSHLVPWELRVLAVRLQGMGFNDARRGVMGYYDLAREARLLITSLKKTRNAKKENDESIEEEIKLWEERLADLGVRVASALIEMEDLEGATRFLSILKPSSSGTPDANLKLETQKALLWLCLGDVDAARSCLSSAGEGDQHEKQVISALAYMADSDFENAVRVWEELISAAEVGDEVAMWKQNVGVCYLYLGRMDSVGVFLHSFTPSNIQSSAVLY